MSYFFSILGEIYAFLPTIGENKCSPFDKKVKSNFYFYNISYVDYSSRFVLLPLVLCSNYVSTSAPPADAAAVLKVDDPSLLNQSTLYLHPRGNSKNPGYLVVI